MSLNSESIDGGTYSVKEVDTCLSDEECSCEECQDQVGFTEDERDGANECCGR